MKSITFVLLSILYTAGTAAAQSGWVRLTSGTTAGLSHISLVGQDTVYVSGGALLRSTDAGATWEALPNAPSQSGVLEFRDDTTGFLVANGKVYKTIDGGVSWDTVGGGYVGVIQFVGPDTGWTFNEGFLTRSTDRGNTWSSLGRPGLGNVYCMTFADALHGYMMGEAVTYPPNFNIGAARLQTSSDGGVTWSGAEYAAPSPGHTGISQDVWGIAALNVDTIFAVGLQIGKTTDGGADWDTIAYPGDGFNSFNAIYFPDNLHGTAVGTTGWIFHTSDGGSTWQKQNSGVTGNIFLNDVRFIDSMIGYVVGANGIILKTINGGLSWVTIAPLSSNQIKGTIFPDPANGQTSLAYNLPEAQRVSLSIQNVTGAIVLPVLISSPQNDGIQTVPMNTSSLSSGTYTYVLQTEKYYSTGKIEVIH